MAEYITTTGNVGLSDGSPPDQQLHIESGDSMDNLIGTIWYDEVGDRIARMTGYDLVPSESDCGIRLCVLRTLDFEELGALGEFSIFESDLLKYWERVHG